MAKDHISPHPEPLRRGRYTLRYAQGPQDLRAAQRLRHRCFVEAAGRAPLTGGLEQDRFDALCTHILIEEAESGSLICCFRVLLLASGADVPRSYSAQYYDLCALADRAAPMAELGRFCVAPEVRDADVLRLAWGALAGFVDAHGVTLLFGCSSFAGTDAQAYAAAFDVLAQHHLAPSALMPRARASSEVEVYRFARERKRVQHPARSGLAQLPPLLKSYLAMGGWVSDHAVIDREMNTLHVFTGLDIATIPAARARALRAVTRQR